MKHCSKQAKVTGEIMHRICKKSAVLNAHFFIKKFTDQPKMANMFSICQDWHGITCMLFKYFILNIT